MLPCLEKAIRRSKRSAGQRQRKNTPALFPKLIEKTKGLNVEANLKDMKTAWDVFRDTRDNEVVPNFFAGKVAEAKAVGGGIQKERFAKISSMVDELLTMT